MSGDVSVKFWGVRGSIPTPLTDASLRLRFDDLYEEYCQKTHLPPPNVRPHFSDYLNERSRPLTYGGNTSCVEIRYRYKDHEGRNKEAMYVLDMGTGIRELGNSLFPEMSEKKGLDITFLISHVHWDHIQGVPFFGPLFENKESSGIKNHWKFYGGVGWRKPVEECLHGQMDAPNFPVSWKEIESFAESIEYGEMRDKKPIMEPHGTRIFFRKLHHPQETYGMRFEFPNGKVVVYTTDHEPWDPRYPCPALLDLWHDADIVITDSQYTLDQYCGHPDHGGVSRRGWGHSYPEATAVAAEESGAKEIVTFHHDPASSDKKIEAIADETQGLIKRNCVVQPAYEGLTITL